MEKNPSNFNFTTALQNLYYLDIYFNGVTDHRAKLRAMYEISERTLP
jgi:hypothetical protein